MIYTKYAKAVRHVYKILDVHIKKFRKAAGLNCPEKCGICCEKPDIKATILEFIPLAIKLTRSKDLQYWLDILNMSDLNGRCVFYKNDIHIPGNGRCMVYPFRALVCRLFNFSVIRDKYGKHIPVICKQIKNIRPDIGNDIQKKLDAGLAAPIMSDYAMQIYSINPSMGGKHYPINYAVKSAIEMIGLSSKNFFNNPVKS